MKTRKVKLLEILQYPIKEFRLDPYLSAYTLDEEVEKRHIIKIGRKLFYLEDFSLSVETKSYDFYVVLYTISDKFSIAYPPNRELKLGSKNLIVFKAVQIS